MTDALTVRGLQKSFGSRSVLSELDLRVPAGSVFALLGDNGAGKTTLLSCVEGILPWDAGEIEIHGSLGVQLQRGSLPDHIRAVEAVRLFSAWAGKSVSQSATDLLGVQSFARRKYCELSEGQRRRLHLALALMRDPDIVILDEPTAGLDVSGRADLHDVIRGLRRKGKTVVLATHDMSEAESLCDRLAILRGGHIAFEGTPDELDELFGRQYRVHIRTDQGTQSILTQNVSQTLADLLAQCAKNGRIIGNLTADRGSLEEHFLKISREEESL